MEPSPSRAKRILLILINILSVPTALVFAFMLFMGGAFASDSGTSTAMAVSFTVIGFALVYPILTLIAIVFSQKRRSYLIALLPFIPPLLLIGWLMSPWFHFS